MGQAATRKSVTVLGITGSVGQSTLDVLRQQKDRFAVAAVTGGSNVESLVQAALALGAKAAAIADAAQYDALKSALSGTGIVPLGGATGVIEAAQRPADIVVAAIGGTAGLLPTHAALAQGRRLALANKECLVCAGKAFMTAAARTGTELMPVDSEHNAIFQSLAGAKTEEIDRIYVTATGGPFRTWERDAIESASLEQALKHPKWSMGGKITIDSAGLMNKGLELIEAQHLFFVQPEQLHVLVHPQAAVHGMVQFRDGSLAVGMAAADMRVPIANAINHPERPVLDTKRLDLLAMREMEFLPPDLVKFPALGLALAAMKAGGAMPTILNAANEIAVQAFIDRRFLFGGIARLVAQACDWGAGKSWTAPASIEDALIIDQETRRHTATLLP
ncbi:MAG: 1-deoxy-D-xylulose-5-phosphate reductoisomerase [Beijerinckiaceae bacterium]